MLRRKYSCLLLSLLHVVFTVVSFVFSPVIHSRSRPVNRGSSYAPTPLTSEPPSRTDLTVIGSAAGSAAPTNAPLHDYPVKEKAVYVQKFADCFNIALNTNNGYVCRHSSKHIEVVKSGFGSKEVVFRCSGNNKGIKDAYLALLLSSCDVSKFLKLIAEQGGVAAEQWWVVTPDGDTPPQA